MLNKERWPLPHLSHELLKVRNKSDLREKASRIGYNLVHSLASSCLQVGGLNHMHVHLIGQLDSSFYYVKNYMS